MLYLAIRCLWFPNCLFFSVLPQTFIKILLAFTLGQLGWMLLIILRHDVDNAFSPRGLFPKGLNYLRLKVGRVFPVWDSFGYLRSAQRLFERERSAGIQASWFFRAVTKPTKGFRRNLVKEGHEIGFHADRIVVESHFRVDLEYVADTLRFAGFTKHGSRGLHTPVGVGLGEVYDLELCIRRAKENGLAYFCGSDVVPTDAFRDVEGVSLFPSVFWVWPGYMEDGKFTVDWLIDYQRDHDVVVLIHPEDASDLFPKVAEKVDMVYARCEEIVSFKEYLRSNKVKRS
jgi:hypothetical protein